AAGPAPAQARRRTRGGSRNDRHWSWARPRRCVAAGRHLGKSSALGCTGLPEALHAAATLIAYAPRELPSLVHGLQPLPRARECPSPRKEDPMAQFDTVIRNAVVATAADVYQADIGILGGVITTLGR